MDSKSEENQEKYDTFLRMLEEIKIENIIEIEKEQQIINKKIPFKVKYSGNIIIGIAIARIISPPDSKVAISILIIKKKFPNILIKAFIFYLL